MSPQISKLVPAVAVALALGACASLGTNPPTPHQVALIHPGLTQEEVRGLAGDPAHVTGDSRRRETMWVYGYTDLWGYKSELDVTFGADGVVTDTYTDRED